MDCKTHMFINQLDTLELKKDRITLIDMNPVEVKYYPFMISLNKCTESSVLPPKIWVSAETKHVNFKTFDMIANKGGSKAMTDHISYDCKCSTACNSNQKWNNKACQYESKNHFKSKKITVEILAHVYVRIGSIKKVLLILQWLSVMQL